MNPAAIRMTFVGAPLFLLLGVVAMKFGWKPNPDLSWSVALPLWTAAHIAYIIGALALGAVLAVLWTWARRVPRGRVVVDMLAAVGAVGMVSMVGQMVIDLIVGFRANERSGMREISRSIKEIPGFEAFFYGVVPTLHLVVAAILIVLLAVRREVPTWSAALFVAGALCIGTNVTPLMVAGGAALCVALPAMTRGITINNRQPAGRHSLV